MAYYSGSANDMAEVRAALVAACVAEGWAWNSSTELLSKGTVFLRLQVVSGYLTLLGRTGAAEGDAPGVVRMGTVKLDTPITYPVTYELFVFEMEVYCVLRFNVDFYLWCAFGKSSVEGLPGTGTWCGASAMEAPVNGIDIGLNGGSGVASSLVGCALFGRTLASNNSTHDYWVHSNLDGGGWLSGDSASDTLQGWKPMAPLMAILPSSWNSESVLLPIRAYKNRPSFKLSLTVDLENARNTRIDNYTPGEVISIGGERWKIFPWYRKNVAARNGGVSINHTGTFGWAIRYEGP